MTVARHGSGKTESFVRTITYLSGAIRAEALGRRNDFGILITPLMGNLPPRPGIHAHDNGVWSEFTSKGKKPFQLDRFLAHLDNWSGVRQACIFAVAPDVVGDWRATLERSAPVLPLIRAKGYRAALVGQNGLEDNLDSIPWADFDVLFLGGGCEARLKSKANPRGEWKLSPRVAQLVKLARAQGKDVHMGRVNSLKRLRYAQEIGCTSADGTIIAFAPDVRTPEVIGWVDTLNVNVEEPLAHNMGSCYICLWKAQEWAMRQGHPERAYAAMQSALDYCRHQPAAPTQLPTRQLQVAA